MQNSAHPGTLVGLIIVNVRSDSMLPQHGAAWAAVSLAQETAIRVAHITSGMRTCWALPAAVSFRSFRDDHTYAMTLDITLTTAGIGPLCEGGVKAGGLGSPCSRVTTRWTSCLAIALHPCLSCAVMQTDPHIPGRAGAYHARHAIEW